MSRESANSATRTRAVCRRRAASLGREIGGGAADVARRNFISCRRCSRKPTASGGGTLASAREQFDTSECKPARQPPPSPEPHAAANRPKTAQGLKSVAYKLIEAAGHSCGTNKLLVSYKTTANNLIDGGNGGRRAESSEFQLEFAGRRRSKAAGAQLAGLLVGRLRPRRNQCGGPSRPAPSKQIKFNFRIETRAEAAAENDGDADNNNNSGGGAVEQVARVALWPNLGRPPSSCDRSSSGGEPDFKAQGAAELIASATSSSSSSSSASCANLAADDNCRECNSGGRRRVRDEARCSCADFKFELKFRRQATTVGANKTDSQPLTRLRICSLDTGGATATAAAGGADLLSCLAAAICVAHLHATCACEQTALTDCCTSSSSSSSSSCSASSAASSSCSLSACEISRSASSCSTKTTTTATTANLVCAAVETDSRGRESRGTAIESDSDDHQVRLAPTAALEKCHGDDESSSISRPAAAELSATCAAGPSAPAERRPTCDSQLAQESVLPPPPPLQKHHLLSPMNFVFRASAEMRAHSLAVPSGGGSPGAPSSLIAQLAAVARSRSLCAANERELVGDTSPPSSRGAKAGKPTTSGDATNSAETLTRRPSRLCLLVGKLKSLSASQPNVAAFASSKRASAAKSQIEIVPHKLESVERTGDGKRNQLFYAPGGVYVGPGGACTWQEACRLPKRSGSAGNACSAGARSNSGGGAGSHSGAASWLARPLRASVAHALFGLSHDTQLRPADAVEMRRRANTMLPLPVVWVAPATNDNERAAAAEEFSDDVEEAFSQVGADRQASELSWPSAADDDDEDGASCFVASLPPPPLSPVSVSAPSKSLRREGGAGFVRVSGSASRSRRRADTRLALSAGEESYSEDSCESESASDRLAARRRKRIATMSASGRQIEQLEKVHAPSAGSAKTGGNRAWLLSLAQRVHSSAASSSQQERPQQRPPTKNEPVSRRASSNSTAATAKPRRRQVAARGASKTAPPPLPPNLAKSSRSNSLSGLHASHSRPVEPSGCRSTLELASVGQHALAAAQDESAESQSSSVSSLQSSPAVSQSIESLSRLNAAANSSPEKASASAAVESYGANLHSSCVHCHLIGELCAQPNAPSSPYLGQLVCAAVGATKSAGQVSSSWAHANRVRPSVVLTACSNQGTMDESSGGRSRAPSDCSSASEPEDSAPTEEASNASKRHVGRPRASSNADADGASQSPTARTRRGQRRVDSLEDGVVISSRSPLGSSSSTSSSSSSTSSSSCSSSSTASSTASSAAAALRSSISGSFCSSSLLTSSNESFLQPNEGQHPQGGPPPSAEQAAASKRRRRRNRRRRNKRRQQRQQLQRKQKKREQGQPVVATLAVPGAGSKPRSASLDAPYLLQVPHERVGASVGETNASLSRNKQEVSGDDDDALGAAKANRSRSVDISLPTKPGESYKLVVSNSGGGAEQVSGAVAADDGQQVGRDGRAKKFIQGEIKIPGANGETRALKLFVNWDDTCVNGEHLWVYIGSSSEACYVGESECLKRGPRLCCSACKITAHTGCIGILIDKVKFICKHTFKDHTISNQRHLKELQQQNVIYHHWVHKRTHCGRCKQCTKTIGNTKLPFSSKEIQAITCSWCKVSYHNKENCYALSTLTEPCSLGAHRELIIPPTWIVKLPSQPANGSDHQIQSNLRNDPLRVANVIDIQNTNFETKANSYCDLKENNENVAPKMPHANSNLSHQSFGSITTFTTETSGYMSSDHLHNSTFKNVNNNNNNNLTSCNYQEKTLDVGAFNDNHQEEFAIVDPSALNAADLSIINQSQGQQAMERHLSIADSMNLAKTIQPQHNYLNLNQPDESDTTTTTMLLDSQPHQHVIGLLQTRGPRSNLCQNFKIIPQTVPGVPNAGSRPVLVFCNPRSGGNQGSKMMQKFNWLLNPRQVFDLIQCGGPRAALELYREVPNLRILTIGGDGTASWILSHLDDIGMSNKIPVAVLPLGTGNDLSRALGWGGGYADEPIAKILTQVRDGEIVLLDRWNLHVERNHEITLSSPSEFSSSGSGANIEFNSNSSNSITSSPSYYGATSTMSIVDQSNCDTVTNLSGVNAAAAIMDESGNDRLPMDVINNYFSFGVDAQIALEFHTAREAHPERFNSRLRNKMFYGQAGGKDLLKRKWKDLSSFVTLYCDGQDMTTRLKELKVHSVLFLNIPSYGGGTRPWPTTATAFAKPKTDDGLIEVIGLTTYQLPLLQAGGHGTCIAQCRSAKIITSRTIPMQVDGEPCKLLPSVITISLKNQVCMLAKSKSSHTQKFNQ